MSIIEMPKWLPRGRKDQRKPFDPRPGAVNVYEASDLYRLPEDMMDELDRSLTEERRQPPLGTPAPKPRTAAVIAQQLDHLREDLTDARAVVKQGEEKEAALVVELAKAVDDEIAVKKATHETEVAELESLRPATGEAS